MTIGQINQCTILIWEEVKNEIRPSRELGLGEITFCINLGPHYVNILMIVSFYHTVIIVHVEN